MQNKARLAGDPKISVTTPLCLYVWQESVHIYSSRFNLSTRAEHTWGFNVCMEFRLKEPYSIK